MIGVAAERFIAQPDVRRIADRLTEPPELLQMHVGDPLLRERLSKRGLAELRMPARARRRADIDQRLDSRIAQHRNEFH